MCTSLKSLGENSKQAKVPAGILVLGRDRGRENPINILTLVAAQWSSWLTHTCPTLEAPPIQQNMVSYFLNFADRNSNRICSTIEQRRVKINSVLIDVRDNENRAKLSVEGAAAVGEVQRIGETLWEVTSLKIKHQGIDNFKFNVQEP